MVIPVTDSQLLYWVGRSIEGGLSYLVNNRRTKATSHGVHFSFFTQMLIVIIV